MTYRKLLCIELYHLSWETTVNNSVAAHWLNILCKRNGVSDGVIAISATLTSRMQLPIPALSSTDIYRPWKLANEKSVPQSGWLFSVGYFATEVVSLEVTGRWLSEVRSVKLLVSDKLGHSKRSDRQHC